MKARKLLLALVSAGSLGAVDRQFNPSPYDLTIVGPVKWRDGLGRISIGMAEVLKEEISINYIKSAFWQDNELPESVKDIFFGQDKRLETWLFSPLLSGGGLVPMLMMCLKMRS